MSLRLSTSLSKRVPEGVSTRTKALGNRVVCSIKELLIMLIISLRGIKPGLKRGVILEICSWGIL